MRFVLLAFGLAACGGMPAPADGGSDAPTNEGGSAPSFTRDVAPIFARSCGAGGSCHGAGAPSGLVLTEGMALQNLVGVMATTAPRLQRVVPGDPEQSFLVMKLEGTHRRAFCPLVPNCGSQMPMIGGVVLANDEMQRIRSWITAGAGP